MNKKYLSALLFGALTLASTGTFTSCKDYDDDIKDLQEQVDAQKGITNTLSEQVKALDAAAKAAQSTADKAVADAAAAVKAAKDAQSTGDQALAAAEAAKAEAEAAKAAAATAKKEAIEKAEELVKNLKAEMDEALATKLDKVTFDTKVAEFNEEVAKIYGQIEAVEEGLGNQIKELSKQLGTLQGEVNDAKDQISKNGVAIQKNAEDISNAMDAIATLKEADSKMQLQIVALEEYRALLEGTTIPNIQNAIEANGKEIGEVKQALFDTEKKLQNQIDVINTQLKAIDETLNKHKGAIDLLRSDLTQLGEDLRGELAEAVEDLENKISSVQNNLDKVNKDLTNKINTEVNRINEELNTLTTILTNRLTSITLAPDFVTPIAGNSIEFYSLEYAPMENDENAEVETDYEKYAYSVSKEVTASYHFNPKKFNTDLATYAFDGRRVKVTTPDYNPVDARSTKLGKEWVEIVGGPTRNLAEGTQDFTLKRVNAFTKDFEKENLGQNKARYIALQATLNGAAIEEGEKDVVVTSDYAFLNDVVYNPNQIFIVKDGTIGEDKCYHFATTFQEACEREPEFVIAYDSIFNLKNVDATCLHNDRILDGESVVEFTPEEYGLTYHYEVAKNDFIIKSGVDQTETNQQTWIKCNSTTEGTFQAQGFNKEAIGRTPILKVELRDSEDRVVRRAFVKIEFTAHKQADKFVSAKNEQIVFNCEDTFEEFIISEEQMREEVYRVLTDGKVQGISHTEFWNMYKFDEAFVTKNGVNYEMSVPELLHGKGNQGTATKSVKWSFSHGELGEIGVGGSNFTAQLVLKNTIKDNDYPAHINFVFNMNVTLPQFSFTEKVENEKLWRKNAEGTCVAYVSNVIVPSTPVRPADECQFMTSLPQAYLSYVGAFNNKACYSTKYRIAYTSVDGKQTTEPLEGVSIISTLNNEDFPSTQSFITLDKGDKKVMEALNSLKGGLSAHVEHVAVLNSGDEIVIDDFEVVFIRPVNLNLPSGLSVKDAVTGGDVVDFHNNDGLLTDWVGNIITRPGTELISKDIKFWKFDPIYSLQVIKEGYYKLVQRGTIKIEYSKSKAQGEANLDVHAGSLTVDFWGKPYPEAPVARDHKVKTFTSHKFLTQSEVISDLNAQATAFMYDLQANNTNLYYCMDFNKEGIQFVSEPLTMGMEFETIKVTFGVAPAYEWVPEVVDFLPVELNARPKYKGEKAGQRDGAWVWIERTRTHEEDVPGNYWDFYGEFKDIKLDVDNVTTNLYGGKLPSTASVSPVKGNPSAIKYENVQSPVHESYEIYVPVELTYGWGTITDVVTITVNPSMK